MAKKRPLTNPSALYRIERRLTPRARAAFLAAVKQWQQQVAAGQQPNPQALMDLVEVTEDGTKAAGEAAALQVRAFRPGSLSFNLTNPEAVRWAEANAARLITEIADETKAAIRQAIARSMTGEMTTGQVGRYVRGIVGLTSTQEGAVANYRDRAAKAGMADADITAKAEKYAQRLRRYRSEVIARTEVLRAENAGQDLLWQQGKASGALTGFVRQWMATPDELECPICARMDGLNAEIGKPWQDPETGTYYDIPQDSHPQCRCSAGLVEGKASARRGETPRINVDESPTVMTDDQKELLQTWLSGDATVYDDMRNPATALGKQTSVMLDTCPKYEGIVHRGMTIDSKGLDALLKPTSTVKWHSSASASESVGMDFLRIASDSYEGSPVLIEMSLHGGGRDLRKHLAEGLDFQDARSHQTLDEYTGTHEVVMRAGTKVRFVRLVREHDAQLGDYLRIVLEEVRK